MFVGVSGTRDVEEVPVCEGGEGGACARRDQEEVVTSDQPYVRGRD
jgi:hypothetical protein